MKILIALLLMANSINVNAQKVIDVTKSGEVSGTTLFMMAQGYAVSPAKYVRVVEGSPFFREEWMRGKILMGNDEMYDSLRLRLDLLDNELQYISADGQEMVATAAIKGVTIIDSITEKKYHFIHSSFIKASNAPQKGWYQILLAGPATLYKRLEKSMRENRPYGSATVEQTVVTTDLYYIGTKDAFMKVKNAKEIGAVLPNHNDAVIKYSKDFKGRTDADFYNVVFFYNSLVETK